MKIAILDDYFDDAPARCVASKVSGQRRRGMNDHVQDVDILARRLANVSAWC